MSQRSTREGMDHAAFRSRPRHPIGDRSRWSSRLVGTDVHLSLPGDQGGVGAGCSASQATCTAIARNPGGSSQGGTDTGSGTSSGGQPAPPQFTCADVPYTSVPGAPPPPAPPESGPGEWVFPDCTDADGDPVNIVPLEWIPAAAQTLPDPLLLAARAESELKLPKPAIQSSPGAGIPQVVELPTWTWMPQAQWAAKSATASVPGEAVTVTAAPVSLSFSWGDGTSSTCQGPGTPYTPGTSDPSAPSPTCGHTYQVTSAAAPGQHFPVTVTLTWKVAWAGAGRAGTLADLATTTTLQWMVEQIQSVLVQGGGL